MGCALLLVVAAVVSGGSPELVVEAPEELAGIAAQVRSLGEADRSSLLDLLGLPGPGSPIRVVLAPERSELARRAPSWVAGYALPPAGTVVLFPTRTPSYPDRNLPALLEHEIAHVMVARAAGFHTLPRWFDEGLATVAAREWGMEDRARFALAVIGGGPRNVAELEDAFYGDTQGIARAYALSSAFVRSLLRRHGETFAARTLAGVRRGESFEDAFYGAAGEPVRRAERQFFRHERVWNFWVPFLTSSTALWIAITFLAIWAIRARRLRDVEIRERWALEEATLAQSAIPARREAPEEAPEEDPRRWN